MPTHQPHPASAVVGRRGQRSKVVRSPAAGGGGGGGTVVAARGRYGHRSTAAACIAWGRQIRLELRSISHREQSGRIRTGPSSQTRAGQTSRREPCHRARHQPGHRVDTSRAIETDTSRAIQSDEMGRDRAEPEPSRAELSRVGVGVKWSRRRFHLSPGTGGGYRAQATTGDRRPDTSGFESRWHGTDTWKYACGGTSKLINAVCLS